MTEPEDFRMDSEFDPEKPNILILFKYGSRWNVHVIKILELRYNVYHGHFMSYYDQLGTLELCNYIKYTTAKYKFRALLVDPEWCDLFNIATVQLLDSILPVGLMFFDDSTMHDYNQVLASAASFTLVPDPIGALQYKSIDIETTPLAPHAECMYPVMEKEPEYDVLWFGFATKTDRPEFVEALEQMTDVKTLIYTGSKHKDKSMSGDLSWEDLSQLISNSRIIVNLSRSDFPFICANYHILPRAEAYQLSGRILEAGYSGRMCISQYAPQHGAEGLDKVMPEFTTPEEMCSIIRHLLTSGELEKKTQQFCDFVRSKYSNKAQADAIYDLIEKANKPSTRYLTRITQQYYNIASGAIKRHRYPDEKQRETEMQLLNNASTKVGLQFKLTDGSQTHSSRTKTPVHRSLN